MNNVCCIKRIGILGGSFDPPTLGHIQMAAEAYNMGHVDEVWIVPCGVRTDKNLNLQGEHRLNMVNTIIQDFFPPDFPIKVNDVEIRHGSSIPTYSLLKMFQDDPANIDKDFYFILGSDLLDGIRRWDDGQKLVTEMNFIIFIRIGYKVNPEVLPKKYIIVNTTFVASSSTEIRNRVKNFCKKHHNHKKLVRRPTIPRAYSMDVNSSFAHMPELELADLERTIDHDEICVDDTRLEVEERYMGILGIVPMSVIKYIKEHHLYCDAPEDLKNHNPSPLKKVHLEERTKENGEVIAAAKIDEEGTKNSENGNGHVNGEANSNANGNTNGNGHTQESSTKDSGVVVNSFVN